ncbi:MAG: IS200/IS605 family transposase [Planctomycetes bacterium]|nr:IS200/IS605 family transposase [Planctomycetota bacterium]
MPQSLSSVYLHLVFSTKDRHPFLNESDLRAALHAYLGSASKQIDCPALAVGGVADHVHMLCRFGRTVTQADWVKEVKRVSSLWLKDRLETFAWQSGYAVFSVGAEQVERVAAYVARQEEHHRGRAFQDELRELLKAHGQAWDERYVWD